MKIAVILFGHLRTFEYCGKYFKENILDKYDCDVFMHTWDETDSRTKSWRNLNTSPKVVDDELKNKITAIYNPVCLKIEHQQLKDDTIIKSKDGKKELSLNGIHYMWYSLNSANILRKEYEKSHLMNYDYVLVTRPDVAVYNCLDIKATVEEAEFAGLNINNVRFFAGITGTSKTNVRLVVNRIPDILYFAKPEVIDRYIQANSNIRAQDCDNKFLNITQIYVKNELKAGIIPVRMCFECGKDWKNTVTIPERKTHRVINIFGIKIKFKIKSEKGSK